MYLRRLVLGRNVGPRSIGLANLVNLLKDIIAELKVLEVGLFPQQLISIDYSHLFTTIPTLIRDGVTDLGITTKPW